MVPVFKNFREWFTDKSYHIVSLLSVISAIALLVLLKLLPRKKLPPSDVLEVFSPDVALYFYDLSIYHTAFNGIPLLCLG